MLCFVFHGVFTFGQFQEYVLSKVFQKFTKDGTYDEGLKMRRDT